MWCVQVATNGDIIICCAISPTSQVLAFGTQGGYVHTHALGPGSRVTASGASVQRPVEQPASVALQEGDSFAAAQSFSSQVHGQQTVPTQPCTPQ